MCSISARPSFRTLATALSTGCQSYSSVRLITTQAQILVATSLRRPVDIGVVRSWRE